MPAEDRQPLRLTLFKQYLDLLDQMSSKVREALQHKEAERHQEADECLEAALTLSLELEQLSGSCISTFRICVYDCRRRWRAALAQNSGNITSKVL